MHVRSRWVPEANWSESTRSAPASEAHAELDISIIESIALRNVARQLESSLK